MCALEQREASSKSKNQCEAPDRSPGWKAEGG
jgi:hypothetical protein